MIDAAKLVQAQKQQGKLNERPTRVDTSAKQVKEAVPYPLQNTNHEYPLKV